MSVEHAGGKPGRVEHSTAALFFSGAENCKHKTLSVCLGEKLVQSD